MGRNQPVKDGAPFCQILESADLVSSHQPAISLDISRKNCQQPALCLSHLRLDMPPGRRQVIWRLGGGIPQNVRFSFSLGTASPATLPTMTKSAPSPASR